MTFIDNVLVFIALSIANTLISIKLSLSSFNYKNWLFKERAWEKKGTVYQSYFHVKKWKDKLPELSDFITRIFSKKQVLSHNVDYLYRFVLETCRAELTHWSIIASSFLFIFWDSAGMSVLMICTASVLNLPYIIIQRYNRPRILNILSHNALLHTIGKPIKIH